MSGIEAAVVAFGLFIGYWLVAKLLAGKPESGSPEWHRTLQVSPDASVEEIQKAYLALISRYHPDEPKSKEVTAAYHHAMQARGVHA
jgi:DnaJ-domain-containing protein 1